MDDEEIRPRRSSMSWNAGGWFGAQLGCSLWLIAVGAVFLRDDKGFAWACIGAGVLLNLWGVMLWSRRETMRAYVGIQLFLALTALVNVAIILSARSRDGSFGSVSPQEVAAAFPYWAMLMAPVCMAIMYLVERRARRFNQHSAGNHTQR